MDNQMHEPIKIPEQEQPPLATVRAILCEIAEPAAVVELGPALASLKAAIETEAIMFRYADDLRNISPNLAIVIDEDAQIKDLNPSRPILDSKHKTVDVIWGKCYIVYFEEPECGGAIIDIPEDVLSQIMELDQWRLPGFLMHNSIVNRPGLSWITAARVY